MQPRAAHLTVRKNGEFSCFQVEMKWGKPMYIFTCRDVWRLGGWCDKVSGCYWPEMTVKAVFANFTATSPDICLLLLALHPSQDWGIHKDNLRRQIYQKQKHCRRHKWPKALNALTQSTPLFQSKSFNNLWNLGQTSACVLSAAPSLSIPPQIEVSTKTIGRNKKGDSQTTSICISI